MSDPQINSFIWFTKIPDNECCGCGVIKSIENDIVNVAVGRFDNDDIIVIQFENNNFDSKCGKFTRCEWNCETTCCQ